MSIEPLTLNDLVEFKSAALTDQQLAAISESRDFAEMSRTNIASFPAALKGTTARAIGRVLEQALDVPFAGLLVQTWNKYQALLQYRDKSRYPAKDVFQVTLADHSITSRHHPRVAVKLNGVQVGEVPFEVELTLKIDGAVLKIQDGKVLSVSTGKSHCEVTMKCAGAILWDKQWKEFALPGEFSFGAGIPILPLVSGSG